MLAREGNIIDIAIKSENTPIAIFMLVDSTVALPYGIYRMSLFAVFFSVAGQFGDLIESAMKRYFGVKDSGKFIPGHGGVLDRFDSMLVVFPIMHLFGLF